MAGNLRWSLVFAGVGIAIVVEILGSPVLPFAVGLYLPIHLSTPMMVGGLIRWFFERKKENKEGIDRGVLYASGLIAGEGLVGIILAILAVAGVADKLNLSGVLNTGLIGGIVLIVVMVACVLKAAFGSRK